ncbi:MAG TPA: hypothetical protein VNO30_43060 [Kofleriaceae bacterium]|nr:hypothetical protein [Kofleriaceae bacterium]
MRRPALPARSARIVRIARIALLACLALAGACKTGGTYEQGTLGGREIDRGETNGRMFDLISNKPDGDDWQVRIRDSSMWAAYASGTDETQLGTVNLDKAETQKIWKMIDDLDLGGRDAGERDEDAGYLQLRIREPGGEEGHDLISVYVTRDTDDEGIVELGTYIQKLILKYHKKKAEF